MVNKMQIFRFYFRRFWFSRFYSRLLIDYILGNCFIWMVVLVERMMFSECLQIFLGKVGYYMELGQRRLLFNQGQIRWKVGQGVVGQGGEFLFFFLFYRQIFFLGGSFWVQDFYSLLILFLEFKFIRLNILKYIIFYIKYNFFVLNILKRFL